MEDLHCYVYNPNKDQHIHKPWKKNSSEKKMFLFSPYIVRPILDVDVVQETFHKVYWVWAEKYLQEWKDTFLEGSQYFT